ncbi:MAG: tripartite tricarboxylate transporter TctB family protein [Pseudomonadota bacterium]
MTLDRFIGLLFLVGSAVYGYIAFVTMEANLLPFERNMSFLPNTLPKWLSVAGVITALLVIINAGNKNETPDFDLSDLSQYKPGQVFALLGMMVVYALALRPIGFVIATSLFLMGGSYILGERKWWLMLVVSGIATLSIWYLVQVVLGIYLRPWPTS